MPNGADAVARKQNKSKRKKLEKDGSALSARISSIIAAKKRRLTGKRSQCQGMCFSLPSEEDPYNERHGKKDFPVKNSKKTAPSKDALKKEPHRVKNEGKVTDFKGGKEKPVLSGTNVQLEGHVDHKRQRQAGENSAYPSKFLLMCLNAIEAALRLDDTCNIKDDKPLFGNPWGVEFLKGYSTGKDALETSGSACTMEQTAWMVSVAADTIARKEKEGLSLPSPYLLFLVPSQEKAAEVRSLCKPLKALGFHTVSLHPGAPIDHQIQGLSTCEPEFLVATPKRLLELISLKAIDISGISFLVVDGMESLIKDGGLDTLKSIRQLISGNPYTAVFNSTTSVLGLETLLRGAFHRLSTDSSIHCQGACIVQTVDACKTEEQKISKGMQVLKSACAKPSKVLYIVGKNNKSNSVTKVLKLNGYSVLTGPDCDISELDTSGTKPVVSVMSEHELNNADLGVYEIVLLPNFVSSIDNYAKILTKMARHTINGVLHSFMSEEDAPLAAPLIEILEQCGQAVPKSLRKLSLTQPKSTMES